MAVTADERALILQTVRDVARERIAPLAAEADATATMPRAWIDALTENGIFALPFDEEHGGTGTGALAAAAGGRGAVEGRRERGPAARGAGARLAAGQARGHAGAAVALAAALGGGRDARPTR